MMTASAPPDPVTPDANAPEASPSNTASSGADSRSRPRRVAVFVAKAAAAIFVAFVALGVLAHIPAGRRLMLRMGAACPVMASPTDTEAARQQAVRALAGDTPAPAKPALGFELGKSKPADVKAWAAKANVRCEERREGTLLRCENVPAAAIATTPAGPDYTDITFAFEPAGLTLVNLTTSVFDTAIDAGVTRLKALREQLRTSLGPGVEFGEFDPAYFAGEHITNAAVTYRFSDYFAEVQATRLRPGRVMVREHYMAGLAPMPAYAATSASAAK